MSTSQEENVYLWEKYYRLHHDWNYYKASIPRRCCRRSIGSLRFNSGCTDPGLFHSNTKKPVSPPPHARPGRKLLKDFEKAMEAQVAEARSSQPCSCCSSTSPAMSPEEQVNEGFAILLPSSYSDAGGLGEIESVSGEAGMDKWTARLWWFAVATVMLAVAVGVFSVAAAVLEAEEAGLFLTPT